MHLGTVIYILVNFSRGLFAWRHFERSFEKSSKAKTRLLLLLVATEPLFKTRVDVLYIHHADTIEFPLVMVQGKTLDPPHQHQDPSSPVLQQHHPHEPSLSTQSASGLYF